MESVSNKMRFGVSYCPYAKSGDVDMKFWDRDFQTMKTLDFNAMRCFVAWDRIELEEGMYDFAKLDYVFELAKKHDIEVMLNVGGVFGSYCGIYPPRWLVRDYKCQQVIENPRIDEKPFGPLQWLCPDDPVFRQKAEDFTIKVVQRYAAQKQLFGWNVWNEAFLQPFCYCPMTITKFQEWLKNKYENDIMRVNDIWGTEFPVLFRNWGEIEPGLGAGFRGGGHVARLDWLEFNRERVASWVDGANRLVRLHDPLCRPTTSNIVASSVFGDPKSHNFADVWSQSRELSIAGFSFYTHFPVECLSAGLAAVRGSSADPAKGFWVLETEAGQVAKPDLYPPETADGPRRKLTHWFSVLHGAKTILLWKFGGRVTDNQSDNFNLTAWDGSITARARLNAETAKLLRDNERMFLGKSYRADIAVLHSTNCSLFMQVEGQHVEWLKSLRGAARIVRDLRIPYDAVSDMQALEGRLSDYKIVILPQLLIATSGLAAKLREFVRAGGMLIADRCLAVKDENSRIFPKAPGFGLQEIFGGYINDYLLGARKYELTLIPSNTTLATESRFYAQIYPDKNAKTIAKYSDGSIAAIMNWYGDGRTVWFGIDCFSDYECHAFPETSEFMRAVFAEAGVETDYEIDAVVEDVEFGALSDDAGKKVHFLMNFSGHDKIFRLRIKSASGKKMKDLLSDFVYDGCRDWAEIKLSPWDGRILFEA